MKIRSTFIDGVKVVDPEFFSDARGSFFRAFCDQELSPLLQGRWIRQINISQTKEVGCIRGLHYQKPPFAEMKMVRCIKGRVWDVALDLRACSGTFLKWHAVELTAENRIMLIIPEGCAHGFQVLERESELLYLHTAPYAPECEGTVRYDDPTAGIKWPLEPKNVSEKDRSYPLLEDSFLGIVL